MTTAVETQSFPSAEGAIRNLIVQHLEITDQPLRLAIYYASPRESHDVFLFEVIDGFGRNSVDEDENLFEVVYPSRDAFPTEPGQELHLLMTNPVEVTVAFRDGWDRTGEVRNAVRAGDFIVVHAGPDADALMGLIRGR